MKTNYISLNGKSKKKKKKTKLTRYVKYDFFVCESKLNPSRWGNVQHIGYSDKYECDVFKAWDSDPNNFCIYFGEKGDEFED